MWRSPSDGQLSGKGFDSSPWQFLSCDHITFCNPISPPPPCLNKVIKLIRRAVSPFSVLKSNLNTFQQGISCENNKLILWDPPGPRLKSLNQWDKNKYSVVSKGHYQKVFAFYNMAIEKLRPHKMTAYKQKDR